VLDKSTWAVLMLTLDIELFTQLHYRQSMDPDAELSGLFKDVFLHHWKEECQHAILDELELVRHDAGLTGEQRDRAVDDFIELVAAVDGMLWAQAAADASYFAANCGRAWHHPPPGDTERSCGEACAAAAAARSTPARRLQPLSSAPSPERRSCPRPPSLLDRSRHPNPLRRCRPAPHRRGFRAERRERSTKKRAQTGAMTAAPASWVT